MSIVLDHVRAEALANIQTTLMIMDGKIAILSRQETDLKVSQSPSIRVRAERTAIALDEIREQVRKVYGEQAKVSSRLVQLWSEIRVKALGARKRKARSPSGVAGCPQ